MGSELDRSGVEISKAEINRALLRILTKEFDITAGSIMSKGLNCNEAVAKLIGSETRLDETDTTQEKGFTTQKRKMTKKCYNSQQTRHLAKDCLSKRSNHKTVKRTERISGNVSNSARWTTLKRFVSKKVTRMEIPKKPL